MDLDKLTLKQLLKHLKDEKMPIKLSQGGKPLKKMEILRIAKALQGCDLTKPSVQQVEQEIVKKEVAKAEQKVQEKLPAKVKEIVKKEMAKPVKQSKAKETAVKQSKETGIVIVEAPKKKRAVKKAEVKPVAEVKKAKPVKKSITLMI